MAPPYPQTSACLAALLTDHGFAVTVDEDVDHAMTDLEDVDLLVVNAGDPWRGADDNATAPADSVEGLDRALISPGHPAIGRMWIPGLSWHPPAGPTTVRLTAAARNASLDAGLSDFTVADERYLRLQQIGTSPTIAEFDHDGVPHPAVWVREHGRSRIVDARPRRALLRASRP